MCIYILIWVTCLFVKEKLWGACTDLPEILCTTFFRTVDHSQGIRFLFSFFFEILICCTQFHWKRTCDTNMRNNNFFAIKTLACGTKTWPIKMYLHQNIHVRHENLAANSGRPWTERTHFALFILQRIDISFNIHNSSENTNNFVTSNKVYSTTECNIQIILLRQHYFLPSHMCVSVLLTIQYSNIMYCLAQSFVSPNRHRVLTSSRKAFSWVFYSLN